MNINMALEDILLLGDSRLYETCKPIISSELSQVQEWKQSLLSTLRQARARYGFGRAIAAPQLGIMKRMIVQEIDEVVTVIINPSIVSMSDEQQELWDDCLSIPNLEVKVKRAQQITVNFQNDKLKPQTVILSGRLSELWQHEIDHLDGILCTMRAIDNKSMRYIPR